MERLKARQAEITRLREERGATDPILIIAGIAITLILLVGGSFAISGFIGNAHNLNAQGDLERIATAQSAYLAQNDGYGQLRVGPNVGTQNTQLQDGALGFTPTDGNSTIVRTSPAGWTAVTKSASGDVFFRSSESNRVFQLTDDPSNPAYGETTTEGARNLFTNPNMVNGNRLGGWAGTNNTATRSIVPVSWSAGGTAARTTWTVGSGGSGDMGPMINWLPENETHTIFYDIWVPTDTLFTPIRLGGSGVGSSQILAASHTANFVVPANTPTRVWVTVSRAANAGSDIRVSSSPAAKSNGTYFDLSNVDTYPGAYQPDRSFFSGSSTETARSSFTWTGTPNNSISVRNDRVSVVSRPADAQLPAGITWAQVGADAATVAG